MQPFFLAGAAGPLFALYRPPASGMPHRGDVLFLPPFAEEMNRARRMATLMAARLAAAGHGMLLLDLYGTGDSAGEFADATVEIWRDDVRRAMGWLAARDAPARAVLALRFGALLAGEAAAVAPLSRIVLWQPVLAGERMLTQFLRVRVAAAMAGGTAETTEGMRARLAAGETLEVAGYALSPALARGIDALRLGAPEGAAPVDWFELAAAPDTPPPAPAAATVDAWRAAGRRVEVRTVAGEPFWTRPETTVAPALVDATAGAFA